MGNKKIQLSYKVGHPFFFNIKTLVHLAGTTWFTQAGQIEGHKGRVNVFLIQAHTNVHPLPRDNFSSHIGALLKNFFLTCVIFCSVCFHSTVQTQKRYPSSTVEDSGSHQEKCLHTEAYREISREQFHHPVSRICHDQQ